MLGAAELGAGRWDAAEEHASAARTLTASDLARLARGDALAAEAAVGRNDLDTAVALATAALEGARETDQVAVECEALEVIGRAERGRDVTKAEAAFTEAHDIAAAAGLRLWQVRALQELGTHRPVHVAGARSPPRGPPRGGVARCPRHRGGDRPAARGALRRAGRPGRVARRVDALRGGVTPLAAVDAADEPRRAGRRPRPPRRTGRRWSEPARRRSRRARTRTTSWRPWRGTRWPSSTSCRATSQRPRRAVDSAMVVLRRNPDAAQPFPGLWALLRTLIDDDGDAARREVAALAVDTPVSRELLLAAEAVALGRAGDRDAAAARFAEADDGARPAPGRVPPGADPSAGGAGRPRRRLGRAAALAARDPGHLRGQGPRRPGEPVPDDHARCRCAGPPPRPGRHGRGSARAGRHGHHRPGGRRPRPGGDRARRTARWASSCSSPCGPSTSTSSASCRRPAPRRAGLAEVARAAGLLPT